MNPILIWDIFWGWFEWHPVFVKMIGESLPAVLLFCSGTLLLYTAIIAPVQIFVWEFDEEKCNVFPSLYFDMFVDIFFMVRRPSSAFIICVWHLEHLEFLFPVGIVWMAITFWARQDWNCHSILHWLSWYLGDLLRRHPRDCCEVHFVLERLLVWLYNQFAMVFQWPVCIPGFRPSRTGCFCTIQQHSCIYYGIFDATNATLMPRELDEERTWPFGLLNLALPRRKVARIVLPEKVLTYREKGDGLSIAVVPRRTESC